ncbi:imidazole glycerol phosphate synthase subunit HisF [Runella limosa]|uniref:imidazole glycerol phosphate synthase subunit HisF n=1 Tax=Runella limosa TaxID=370978 RepID=UPI00048A8477|nr:imidazole glycerol phosphate synthase cyclase subunit [Runella limosa]
MLKTRIIPILTFNGWSLVKTKRFSTPRMLGNPVQAARVYNSRGVDELIFLDIFASKQKRKINLKIVKDVIDQCFMPVGIGGGISTISDIKDMLKIGADKVVLKTAALLNPDFIKESSDFFGSQCISVSVDAVKNNNGIYTVYNEWGVNITMNDFIQKVQNLGAGEIILNSVENDGVMEGFDRVMYNEAQKVTNIPIVCVGGGGELFHYDELFAETNCEAVGSASIFHFTQYTPFDIKDTLKRLGKPVRI